MSNRLILFLCCLFTLGARSQSVNSASQLSAEDRAFLESVNKPVVLTLPGMDSVSVTKNIVYKKTLTAELKADLYRPTQRKGHATPVVIFIHGGVGPEFPVRPKDWGVYQSWGRLIAASGLSALVFNHRAGFPNTRLAEATEDLADVVGYVRSHAADWNVDGDRICLAAFSGGGPLLSYAMREHPPFIKCQVGMYPIVDIGRIQFIREQMSADELSRISPVEHVRNNSSAPPLLIARAGADQIPDLLAGLDPFIALAISSDADISVLNNPGAPHAFDNKEDTPRTREILKAVIAFLHAHLDQ